MFFVLVLTIFVLAGNTVVGITARVLPSSDGISMVF